MHIKYVLYFLSVGALPPYFWGGGYNFGFSLLYYCYWIMLVEAVSAGVRNAVSMSHDLFLRKFGTLCDVMYTYI